MKNQKQGKIVRIKKGYNPNSSSIGSIIFTIPTMLFVLCSIFGAVMALIMTKLFKAEEKKKKSS